MSVAESGFATTVHAIPVTYTETFSGASGGFGIHTFGAATVVLSLTGDTDNVIGYDVAGSTGYVNAIGTASFAIYDSAGTVEIFSADFLAGQVYVSVDNTNLSSPAGGIGFGSYNADGSFDPLYPYSILADQNSTALNSYDLKSNLSYDYYGISCSGFDVTDCVNKTSIVPLATTVGDFYIDWQSITMSNFTTVVDQTAQVPEPGSLALLPLGLGMLGFVSRKKKKRA